MGQLTLSLLLLQVSCIVLQVTSQVAVPTKPAKPDDCVVKSADIAFVIDASGSVDAVEWKQSLDFASTMVRGYDVGKDKVRVALIVFSNTAKIVFDFNKYTTKAQVIAAIAAAPKESQSTYTHLALNMARQQLYQTARGMRPNVPNMLIVITDGLSTVKAETVKAAKAVHQAGITVVAVGVKGATPAELQVIASQSNLVYSYSDFNKLVALQDIFKRETCKVAVKLATRPPAPTKPVPITTPCVVKSADIGFIVDASGSVDANEWKQSLDFAKNIVQGYDIGPNKVRVSLIEFSSGSKLVFNFNKYTTKAALLNAIAKAPKSGGGTNTDASLNMARDAMFQAKNGDRPGVPNILFVITDGNSGSAAKTKASAATLHKKGVTVFAIGVKGANMKELQSIASKPAYVYMYNNFNKLAEIQKIFNKQTCQVAVKLAPTTPKPAPKTTKPGPFAGCTVNSADLVFVVDTSSSVGESNFKLMKTFLSTMMDRLDFRRIRVGLIQFNDNVKTVFTLNKNNNLASAKASVNGMKYEKGAATRISAALKHMREESFKQANGDRLNVPNIGIILTDGQSKDSYRTQWEANKTKSDGIELFAIGIGNDINQNELESLSSSKRFVYLVNNYGQLSTIRDVLAGMLCQGFTMPPSTTKAPCLCKDTEKDCKGYQDQANVCFDYKYRKFAIEKCPVYCDLCPAGCTKVYPPPKPCKDTIPDCARRIDVCTDLKYRTYALQACPKYCKLCPLLIETPIKQTTTPSTIPTTTRTTLPPKTKPPVPTKPTIFKPCDPNCYDTARDCKDYDFSTCKLPQYETFFKVNCAKTCEFCTPKAGCGVTPGACVDKQDCSGYADDACVNYPSWAKTSCPKRCGLCPGDTPVTLGTTSTVCEDLEDCSAFGGDVCTDFYQFSLKSCRLTCGHCVGTTTTPKCIDKRDCSKYDPATCRNPDYRKFMLAECRAFCKACNDSV